MKALIGSQRIFPFTRLLLLGSVLELLFILICMLLPFNVTFPVHAASDSILLWTFSPTQPLVLKNSLQSLQFTDLVTHMLLLCLIMIALSGVYLYLVGKALQTRNDMPITARWLLLPIIGATTFGITLLVLPMLYNNEAHNSIFKSLALLSHLMNCVLIWAILSKVAPRRRLEGTILYAWNPLALIELAGYGNNDGLFIFFLLVTTLLIIQLKGHWYDFWGMVFLGCAIGMNAIALFFAPMMIYFSMLRKMQKKNVVALMSEGEPNGTTNPLTAGKQRRNSLQLLWKFAWRSIIVLSTALVLYLIFQQHSLTFTSIISYFDMQYFVHSPLSIMVLPVQLLNSFLFRNLYPPTALPSNYLLAIPAGNMAVQASAIFIFILIYSYLFSKIQSAHSLFTCLCLTTLGFLVFLSGQFWPWYILWALWIIALRRFDPLTMSVLIFSCTALLTYPLLYIDNIPISIFQPLLIFGIPLFYLIIRLTRSSERMNVFYDRRSETAKN